MDGEEDPTDQLVRPGDADPLPAKGNHGRDVVPLDGGVRSRGRAARTVQRQSAVVVCMTRTEHGFAWTHGPEPSGTCESVAHRIPFESFAIVIDSEPSSG